MNKISIVIPVYNEVELLEKVLEKVESASFCTLEKEIILVDDCSTDGTKDLYPKLPYKTLFHERNMGKGGAMRTGIAAATGDIVVVQDADLEYDPNEYEPVVRLIFEGKADVAYGTRLGKGQSTESFMLPNLIFNRGITLLTNILYRSNLTDMETCYKAFSAKILEGIELKSDGFGFDPEITGKVLKRGARFAEAPISYTGRTHAQGKKITWRDIFPTVWALIKYRFVD